MNASRAEAWERLGGQRFDLLVIGAGIVGARIAFEAARAGMSVALVDAGDFGGATSSASSKLIHGGFRYLAMGDLHLVWESQCERRALMGRIAPHLVRRLPMVLAAYRGGPTGPITAAAGVLAYGALCGFRGTGVSLVQARAAQRLVPSLRTERLSVCGVFDEGQTNDARLVLDTVGAAAGLGATVLNYARVVALDRQHGRLASASILGLDGEGIVETEFRYVINASGPWVDKVRLMEDAVGPPMARLSKGIHVLLEPQSKWRAGVVVPLEGGRVTMALPWQGMLMLGTTDADYEGDPADCAASPAEVRQVLAEASLALPPEVTRAEAVRFTFAGLRVLPLGTGSSASSHREHVVRTGRFGMVSIAGGKLTTHRRIALEALHRLPEPRLADLHLVDIPLPQASRLLLAEAEGDAEPDVVAHLVQVYGRVALSVMRQRHRHRDAFERIHPAGPDVWAQVYHASEEERAVTVEDVMRRRTTVAVRGLATPGVRARVGRILASTPSAGT